MLHHQQNLYRLYDEYHKVCHYRNDKYGHKNQHNLLDNHGDNHNDKYSHLDQHNLNKPRIVIN
ncbi:MAG: hypothetical protein F6K10_42340 [Moorea sp. SIO2B7]|nr:hypothetical protein [Moorena sp. SIO2B7]